MTRCAIYARYSSDRQNERSIADQFTICREYADRQGWHVAAEFSDAGISGSAMANRPGLLGALSAAERGEFDVLLSEDEDRFARDAEHQWHVFNRLEAAGVRLATISSGEVTDMHVAFKGLLAQQFLRNLSAKTKRGMRSNAEKGLATGARLYGYRSQPGGQMEIVEEEATVVRRIFKAYAAGDTAREIAATLNADAIPGPRGGLWNASTIGGSRQRGNGILHTEMYVGVKVWGRNHPRKDRATGKRQQNYVPPDQWQRTPVPHLRIVDDETWAAVRARKSQASASPHAAQRRPGLFSGLLKCGVCGGSYTSYTSGKLVCATYRERGTCTNRRTPKRAAVEARVLEALREQMLSPEATATYLRAYQQAAAHRKKQAQAEKLPIQKRLAEVDRRITRAVDAILDGTATAAVKDRLMALEAEKVELTAKLDAADAAAPQVELHPRAAEAYAAMVADLESHLRDCTPGLTENERRADESVRHLVDRIVITPLTQERGGPIDVVIEGTLMTLLNERPENVGSGGVVAGGGIEPPTCGL